MRRLVAATHRETRGAAGVTQISNLTGALPFDPFQGRVGSQLLSFIYQLVQARERCSFVVAFAVHRKDEYRLFRDSHSFCSFEGGVQKGHAGEQGPCAGRSQLMLKLGGRVGGTRWGDDSVESVDRVHDRNVVNGVEREDSYNALPLRAIVGVKPQPLGQCAGDELNALDSLGCRIR